MWPADPRSRRIPRDWITHYDYNAKDQVTRVTDARGGQTAFTYDPTGRVLTLSNARNPEITFDSLVKGGRCGREKVVLCLPEA